MDFDSSIFDGFRLYLAGFNSQHLLQVKSKIVNEGGVVLDQYGPNCTHVVVHNLIYDDIICATARRDGKTVVTSLWLDHSFEAGEPIEAGNVMYRPPRELFGIPGADKFIISVTGYHGPERDDIKTLVCLMGAEFSKQLKANETTHLVCYKFEGEKYNLAKLKPYTKIVNHQWLSDCLQDWKIHPEEPYSTKSGYEITMMDDQAEDFEYETRDVSGRNNSWVTNLQHEMGDAPNNSVIVSKVAIPSRQQGISSGSVINDETLPESDRLSESRNVNKLDKKYESGQKDQSHLDAKSENANGQNIVPLSQNIVPLSSNQIVNGAPFTSENHKNSADLVVKKLDSSNYSRKTLKKNNLPVHVREDLGSTYGSNSDRTSSSKKSSKSRASLQPAGKLGKSDTRLENNLAENMIDDVQTSISCIDKEEATSGPNGVLSYKMLNDSVARKHSPSKSRDSGISLKSSGKLSNLDGTLDKGVAEEVIADVGTSNKKDGLINENGLGELLPQKRTADDSKNFHSTSKSQKLTSPANKRVDAAGSTTSVTNTLEKRKSGSPDSLNRIGDESAGLSSARLAPNVSSVKPNSKYVVPSGSLAFEVLQGRKSINTDVLVSPNSNNSISTSPGVKNKTGEPENSHQHGAASSVANDLEAVKSRSPKLNSGDQTGSSVSKPPRRKMVARKTLGSRRKLSKSSFSKNSFGDDTTTHSVDQAKREEPARSLVVDEVPVPSAVDEPVCSGSRPNLKSSTDMIDSHNLLEDETDAPPELEVNNEKPLEVEKASDVQLYQDSISASDNTSGQKLPETVEMKQNLVPQKKGRAVKAKKKTLLTEEGDKNEDEAEGGKRSDKVKDQVGGAAKKRRGTLILNKSKSSVEIENENEDELVSNNEAKARKENELLNDQHATSSGKLELKNRQGIQVSKKSKAVQKQNENMSVYQGDDDSKNHGDKSPTELAATSNTTLGNEEVKSKSDPSVSNDQGASKVVKRPGKLAGNKRRGTLLLRKSDIPDEANKENVQVLDGGQHHAKAAGASNIFKGSMEVERDNVQALGENQDTSKGRKRAGNLAGKKRRGTLGLNKTEARADEEKENESVLKDDEDKRQGGRLTGKPASKSNLTATKSIANSTTVKKHELKEVKKQSACFIVSGHRLQRKEFQQLIKRLKGKVCRDSHQWSYQATHFIVPDPIRRTEKFFAAAASGSWVLKTDYLTASNQAGKLLPEEPYEWHKNGLTEDGAISLEAPRKWRLLRERTGHGAFYGMKIVIYGECIAPPLDTLKRVVKAGDGTILATSPPYTRFLQSGVDFAIISPGTPRVDIWVQEFLRHQVPCVLADYLVEYVCKPGYSLDRHVQFSTHEWAANSFSKLSSLSKEVVIPVSNAPSEEDLTPDNQVSEDLACIICGSIDRGEVMLVCGDEFGSKGCGIGTHIDCCNPPLEEIPEDDWFCPNCSV